MDNQKNKLRWSTWRRLEFIEYLLYWEGTINRSSITERFGVSVPQASDDLALYKEHAPDNMAYDPSAKQYVAAHTFKTHFLKPNPDRYLAQLKGLADGILELDNTDMSYRPDTGVLPIPNRRINPDILRSLVKAVRDARSIKIKYQSMNPDQPSPIWRWISPHAFGSDGLRWHVRAYCHRRNSFNDFIVGRCLEATETGAAEAVPLQDWCWQNSFDVVLEPNPILADGQRKAIAMDYGMNNMQVSVSVRYALLYYFEKRLRLDVGNKDNPRERPIVVANAQEFKEALDKADTKKGESIRATN